MTRYGHTGRVLRVDLGAGTVLVEEVPEERTRLLYGGRAWIAHSLLQETPAGVDPLSGENLLVFATGPITGAPVSGPGRHGVGAKSPLTGGIASSEAGGYWGAELKRAGFDAVMVKGESAVPVWLWINDGTGELRDAEGIWGLTTAEADAWLRTALNDNRVRTSLIGPAGERQVRYANVVTDRSHFAGRGGLGAVMGAKRLKGLVVRAAGSSSHFEAADPQSLQLVAKWMGANLSLVAHLHDTGTSGGILPQDYVGGLPTLNFREGQFAGAELISGERMRDTILVGRDTCFACAVRCKRVVETTDPYNVPRAYGGPEYETIAGFGSNLGISNLPAIAHANALCAANGLDTISASGVIAFAMECFESGALTEADTDGVALRFGDADAAIWLLHRIIHREGIGDVLAEGVSRAAALIGGAAQEAALHVKGQELPLHEPRMKPGMGLGYAVSPTGADHEHNMHDDDFVQETLHLRRAREFGAFSPLGLRDLGEEKVRLFTTHSNWQHLLDCLVICRFLPYDVAQTVEIVRAVTGWDVDKWELLKVGERAATLSRMFNLREGITARDDRLPDRFFQPLKKGPLAGAFVDPDTLKSATQQYYREMGWDVEGKPTQHALEELGIAYLARQ